MSFEQLLAVAARFGRTDAPGRYADEKPPLRAELFSTDQFPYVIEQGERATEAQIPYLKRLLDSTAAQ